MNDSPEVVEFIQQTVAEVMADEEFVSRFSDMVEHLFGDAIEVLDDFESMEELIEDPAGREELKTVIKKMFIAAMFGTST